MNILLVYLLYIIQIHKYIFYIYSTSYTNLWAYEYNHKYKYRFNQWLLKQHVTLALDTQTHTHITRTLSHK